MKAEIFKALLEEDIEMYLRKNEEYGDADLRIMGNAMLELCPQMKEHGERGGIEMALAFYMLGKVARMFGAYAEGRPPSDDTFQDLTVYSLMARMNRIPPGAVIPTGTDSTTRTGRPGRRG